MLLLNPLFALVAYVLALTVSSLLINLVTPIRQAVSEGRDGRYGAIDGLRGYLAFGVFVHHTVITWFYVQEGGWQSPPSNLYTHLGETSVALFFMITSFLFWGRMLDKGSKINWLELLISRVFRLYPLYLFAVATLFLIVGAMTNWQLQESITDLAKNMFQWLTFTIIGAPDVNGFESTGMLISFVTWSLRFEWLFYLSLPLFGAVFAKTGKPVAALFSTAIIGFVVWRGFNDPTTLVTFSSFLGGVAAAYWVRRDHLKRLANHPVAGFIALACIAFVIFLTPSVYAVLPVVLLSIAFMIIASGNSFGGALHLKPAVWLGEISYSLYLLHGLLVWFVFQYLFRTISDPLTYSALALGVTIVLVVACSLTFLLIEKPTMILGKQFIKLFKPKPVLKATPEVSVEKL